MASSLRFLEGYVISDKMDKSILVEIRQRMQHPLYKKTIWQKKTLMAHDEHNQARVGDKVQIALCRPLSKRKRFRLIKVLKS